MAEVFELIKKIPKRLGRAGSIKTPHGEIKTPAFIPVATKGVLKGVSVEQLSLLNNQALLANTYHLHFTPGEETVSSLGGLHKFMSYPAPLFTDSGGFQVFSLGAAYGVKGLSKFANKGYLPVLNHQEKYKAKIDDEGVSFRSPLDGRIIRFNAEKSIEIQYKLGADIIFVFDECVAPSASFDYQKKALIRTHEWAIRSLNHYRKLNSRQLLFGIVQGGRHQELRELSAKFLANQNFSGYGIGGSFDKEDIGTAVSWAIKNLPENKPRHLLGIGEPEDILAGVENGIDTFDCVAPTRRARNGSIYLRNKTKINLLNSNYRKDDSPLDYTCLCPVCQKYSRGYLAHLLRAKEMLGATLCSIHNLYFIINFTNDLRQAILDDNFIEFKDNYLSGNY